MSFGQVESAELFRFESLGDNCEFGFVMRALGHEFGGVLKWARSEPEQIAALLRAQFAGSFLFDNLSPYRDDMVLDASNGIGWHTTMFSRFVNGERAFADDAATRHDIWQGECRKMRYLEARFRHRLQIGGSIFVIKSNHGCAPDRLDDIHAALDAMAGGASYGLLEVCASDEPGLFGTVDIVGPGRLRGFVPRFAPYDDAAQTEFAAWTRLLAAAIRLLPCADWQYRLAKLRAGAAESMVELPFPARTEPDLTQPLLSDLRVGWVALEGGNSWCRMVEDGFRLHGSPPDQPPAVLRWTGVRLPGACHLSGRAACPVDDSLPVRLHLQIDDDAGVTIAEQTITVRPDASQAIGLDATMPVGRAVTITLSVNAVQKVADGQRAVVDLSTLRIMLGQRPAAGALHAA